VVSSLILSGTLLLDHGRTLLAGSLYGLAAAITFLGGVQLALSRRPN
jgi:hypothetical protein